MGTENRNKLKNLIQAWPPGVVATYPWLKKYHVYQELTARYLKSGWIERIGTGAFQRAGDKIDWPGVVFTLQEHLKLTVHIGARSAIELRGFSHFVRFKNQVTLYGEPNTKLPKWCLKINFQTTQLKFITAHLFKNNDTALSKYQIHGFDLTISPLERAILELLWQVPQKYSYTEAAYIMENLTTLRPNVVQTLLEQCRSIKAKRLFLHLATKCNHSWLKKVNLEKVDLGSGPRKIDNGSCFDKTYQLYVPESQLNEGQE
ncbi:MAG: type IV toxin-antitoxin system AbiEi family antitoxin [Proteobacteria bacterium]|nr:type IV toxin-antitoxin system AbiEi family antitoxin [Pseudomonadota bacterium]